MSTSVFWKITCDGLVSRPGGDSGSHSTYTKEKYLADMHLSCYPAFKTRFSAGFLVTELVRAFIHKKF